jgi:hypothetical protein
MGERKRREGARVWGEAGRQGRAGQGRAKLGQAGPTGLGRVAGPNLTTRTTTDRNPNAKRNPQRDETNARLNMTSNKRDMLRHDATPMTT